MKRTSIILAALAITLLWFATGPAKETKQADRGEAAFNRHCAVCHPDGGNTVNPQKTLHLKDLKLNNIATPSDIIEIMRKPRPGMYAFDESTVPDPEARLIAEYILKTFK